MLAQALAQVIAPPDFRYQMLGLPTPATVEWQTILARFSPNQLFGECVLAILSPTTRALGPIYVEQLQGAVVGSGLPLSQSLLIAWPQMVGLVAGTIVLFVIGYVVFQRQEVRA
jgi:ABC-2 type transport system permease protein